MPKILPNIREKIIEEGDKMLIEGGYNNLNIREIAKRCDIGTGTLYNYFSNKDELVKEIVQKDWNTLTYLAKDLINTDSKFKEKIETIYTHITKFLSKYIVVFNSMISSSPHSCPRKKLLDSLYLIVEQMIKFHIHNGDINSSLAPIKLAKIIVGNILFLAHEKDITFEDFYSTLNI